MKKFIFNFILLIALSLVVNLSPALGQEKLPKPLKGSWNVILNSPFGVFPIEFKFDQLNGGLPSKGTAIAPGVDIQFSYQENTSLDTNCSSCSDFSIVFEGASLFKNTSSKNNTMTIIIRGTRKSKNEDDTFIGTTFFIGQIVDPGKPVEKLNATGLRLNK